VKRHGINTPLNWGLVLRARSVSDFKRSQQATPFAKVGPCKDEVPLVRCLGLQALALCKVLAILYINDRTVKANGASAIRGSAFG